MSRITISDDLCNRLLSWAEHRLTTYEGFVLSDRSNLMPAAVLVPLFVTEDGWNLLYTRRTNKVESHQGQVSFPGGACEAGDASRADTALREAYEEIGLAPRDVRILGELPEMELITRFTVRPVVGMIPWPYEFKPAEDEVARIFSVPLDWLADPANSYSEDRHVETQHYKVLYYKPYDGETVWGATAYMTWQLLQALQDKSD
ncbi:MAG: NUDIX hydrolase [Anaerolineaceae bacterium]